MIRNAKARGWLTTQPGEFETWSRLSGIQPHEVRVDRTERKGNALLAGQAVSNTAAGAECLLTVPRDLILSLETVREHARVDADLREVLGSLGDFGNTARGAILVFLLTQISTIIHEELGVESVGVHTTLTHYVKSLPCEDLPTSWNTSELKSLVGTTLAPAISFKLRSLRREYDLLVSSAATTRWFQLLSNHVQFDDWLCVDAMYRSRALDYPGIGHCMVPYLDLANHASGDQTVAVYDLDREGNAVLMLREGYTLAIGDEVTISYGDEKGACEMLFSYGFIEHGMSNAQALFLDLDISDDDPLASLKRNFADCAPGVKILDAGDAEVDWKSDYIWLLCVTTDDFNFAVARLNDGTEEIQASFGDQQVSGAAELSRLLGQSKLWPVYRLRAVTLLQERVFEQLKLLTGTEHDTTADTIDLDRQKTAERLRTLEADLLYLAYENFEKQVNELANDEVVLNYLEAMKSEDCDDSDFR